MSLSRIAAHTRAAGRYRTGSNDSEPGLRCQYRPPRYTCNASGRSPGSRAGLIPVNHLPAPCAVVCRFTLSRLPLRGQRRHCQVWLTHRLPVSSLGRLSSGHLKQSDVTLMSVVKGVKLRPWPGVSPDVSPVHLLSETFHQLPESGQVGFVGVCHCSSALRDAFPFLRTGKEMGYFIGEVGR